jgi:hypothetical protein
MSSSARRGAIVCVALAAACVEHTPLAPGPSSIVVHAVLNPAEQVQHVIVTRTTNGGPFPAEIPGARVQLITPDGRTLVGSEVRPTVDTSQFYVPVTPLARYDISAGAIAAGRRYRLHVELPSGEVSDGDAVVPSASPAAQVSARRFDRLTDTLRLSWPRVAGASAYEVRVTSVGAFYVGASPQGDSIYTITSQYVAYVDTSVVLPGTMEGEHSGPVFFPNARHDVVVSAVDANYYEYYRHGSDPFTATSLPTSLRGAFGVFGAMVPILRMKLEGGAEQP